MLPPESTATTGGSHRPGSASSAAMPAAPAGSTTSLARSRQNSSAREIAASETVTTSSTTSWTSANGSSPGPPTAIPSAIVAIRSSAHRVPGGQRGRVRRGLLGLHRDHPHVRPQRLDRDPDPGHQPAAAGADQHRPDLRALLQDLQPDGALPGHDVGVVERVHQHRPGLGLERPRATSASSTDSPASRTSAP